MTYTPQLLVLILLGIMATAQTRSTQTPATPAPLSVNGPPASAAEPDRATGNLDATDPSASLPDLLPQPHGNPTLIGGTIRNLDLVRDQFTVAIFGGGRTRILFDNRTHFYRDGKLASARDLANGERVYVDTVLAGSDVFARNVRVVTHPPTGQSNGKVLSYEPSTGKLTVIDALSPEPLELQLTTDTVFLRDNQTVSPRELRPGALVAITFGPEMRGHDVVRQVVILAEPGSSFTFAGRIVYLDVHRGLLVLKDPRDQRSYEIHFDPAVVRVSDDLREGMDVTVITSFNGNQYTANAISISPTSGK